MSVLPVHGRLSDPELLFHPEREADKDRHPLNGLLRFGPFSRSIISAVLDPIRVCVVAPSGDAGQVKGLVRELERQHRPRERLSYLVDFPGFARVFGVAAVLAEDGANIEIPSTVDEQLLEAERPHLVLAEQLTRALSALRNQRTHFDVALLYLPIRWANAFYGGEGDDFDLHDHLKAISAAHGVPLQIVREDKAIAYPCRCSVMWRLGIALYCKAGGIPWTLAGGDAGTAYIGIGYALRQGRELTDRFVTCCSQVFDAGGIGLEFILYEPSDLRMEGENPFLSRSDMRKLMARSLQLYQRKRAGRAPNRVVVHKSTSFTRDEVEGCFDAWRPSGEIDLVHVQQDVFWRGVKIDPPRDNKSRGIPSSYPCERGTYLPIGTREVLLWTQGNLPEVAGGRNFYKEGKAIPSPLLLERSAGHGPWDDVCWDVLGLSKMDWNNDGPYDRLPVTLRYAGVLARIVKRMPELGRGPYEFRFFM